MHDFARFRHAPGRGFVLFVLALFVLAPAAMAQGQGSTAAGATTISIGGGVQLLQLPDVEFTFFSSNTDGKALRKQKNDDFDDYGGAVSGLIETALGYWGSTPVTGVVSGFYANVEDSTRRGCSSNSSADCTAESIVDRPGEPDSFSFTGGFATKTDRDVDFWGAGVEARFGKHPAPVAARDGGGYLFRFAYAGIGADLRSIDQDMRLRLDASGASNPVILYREELDTTYWGGYLTAAGEYNILGYLGIGQGWGLRSMIALRAGLYNAETDYRGRFASRRVNSALSLSDDELAFIGGVSFETRKQFGARTSLSLLTDYEYFSYAPQMRYVDADRGGCLESDDTVVNCAGRVGRTRIDHDDAFAVRTMLRLNIGLGTPALYAAPVK